MTLYWDVPGGRLIQSTLNAAQITSLSLYARDTVPLNLFLLQEDGDGGYEEYTLTTGLVPIVMAKPAADLDGDARFGTNFGEQDADGAWVGLLELLDTTLLSEVDAAGVNGASYRFELTLHNESQSTDSETMQVNCTVYPDVHRDNDPLPSITSPTGPWEYFTTDDGRKGLRLRNEQGTIVAEFVEP